MFSMLLSFSSSSLLSSSIRLLLSGRFWISGTSLDSIFSGFNLVRTRSTSWLKTSKNNISFVNQYWLCAIFEFDCFDILVPIIWQCCDFLSDCWRSKPMNSRIMRCISVLTMLHLTTKFCLLLFRGNGGDNSRLLTIPLLHFSARLSSPVIVLFDFR